MFPKPKSAPRFILDGRSDHENRARGVQYDLAGSIIFDPAETATSSPTIRASARSVDALTLDGQGGTQLILTLDPLTITSPDPLTVIFLPLSTMSPFFFNVNEAEPHLKPISVFTSNINFLSPLRL